MIGMAMATGLVIYTMTNSSAFGSGRTLEVENFIGWSNGNVCQCCQGRILYGRHIYLTRDHLAMRSRNNG